MTAFADLHASFDRTAFRLDIDALMARDHDDPMLTDFLSRYGNGLRDLMLDYVEPDEVYEDAAKDVAAREDMIEALVAAVEDVVEKIEEMETAPSAIIKALKAACDEAAIPA